MKVTIKIQRRGRTVRETVCDLSQETLGAAVGAFLDKYQSDFPDLVLLDDDVRILFAKAP